MNYIDNKGHLLLIIVLLLLCPLAVQAQNRQLTFKDIMKWEDIDDPEISANGQWLAYSVWPDRGDGEVRVRNIDTGTMYVIPFGDSPNITRDGGWVGAYLEPKLVEQIKAEKNKPKQGLALLNTSSGKTIEMDSVASYQFSNNGKWVAVQFYQSEKEIKQAKKNKYLGSEMLLQNLSIGQKYRISNVKEAAFDSTSSHVVYSVVDSSGSSNGLYYRKLDESPSQEHTILSKEDGLFANLSWDDKNHRLAFTEAVLDTTFETDDAYLKIWDATNEQTKTLVAPSEVKEGWALRTNNDLEWTDDGNRLFFGLMPRDIVNIIKQNKKDEKPDSIDIYNFEQIFNKKGVDIWHYKDPFIKPYAKRRWDRYKNRTYRAVYHFEKQEWAQLADQQMPNVAVSQNSNFALGSSEVPYRIQHMWNRTFRDYYIVDLHTGERKRIVKEARYRAQLSPQGKYVVFYQKKDWHLYNIEKDMYRNLTEKMEAPFYDVDYDRPQLPSSYGIGGWVSNDDAVLIYDKYDIWKFKIGEKNPVNLTQDGRDRDIRYRIVETDEDKKFFQPDEELLIRGFYYHKKTYGFYTLDLDGLGVERRLESPHRYDFVAKAEDTNRIIYSREGYDEYPNLWISNSINFDDAERITNLHLDLHDKYNWGTASLIEWHSLNGGEPLQGALIKPDNYEEDKKYPVLIYFYEQYSQRAYEFNNITNDDRPTIPQWVSDGYVVFLPDIRYETGIPGFSATKSLVPGVLKLIEMGIADPDKIGIHGHSWGGYETAFIITQTDIFAAAIAGAPVGNMTSAYSGIRWGSGHTRQSQYEHGQSRIGGSLWEYPERYIENSPVFFADRINTPLLIMAGDKDTAVPWYQDIELFLALRRLGKPSVFLQYRGEPHHLQKYANRLDYAIKMKQYFDHYLRGEEAPEWLKEGVLYRGK